LQRNFDWLFSNGSGGCWLLDRRAEGQGVVTEIRTQTSQGNALRSLPARAGHMTPSGNVPRSTAQRLVSCPLFGHSSQISLVAACNQRPPHLSCPAG
jgi:hypothetical protein